MDVALEVDAVLGVGEAIEAEQVHDVDEAIQGAEVHEDRRSRPGTHCGPAASAVQ